MMQILAGRFKGRSLIAPEGATIRPTSGRLRGTIFDVLGPAVTGARVLDGYAGTGALGLEALSRGAAHVTFIERDARALAALQANVAHCGAENACAIIRADFLSPAARAPRGGAADADAPFDLVLLDPPYAVADLGAVLDAAEARVNPSGRLVLEHSRRRASPESAGSLRRFRLLVAGDAALAFYVPRSPHGA